MSQSNEKIKIVKLFASSEYKIRNKAYKSILRLLKFELGSSKKQLSEKDIISIWKGLYVWLWMQDKPILHEEVVEKICNLISIPTSDEVALVFIKGFFVTMEREWRKIDVHRMDKYYMLMRDFLASALRWCSDRSWQFATRLQEILDETVLQPTATRSMGMKLHFIDIFLDELVKVDAPTSVSTALVATVILSLTRVNYQDIYVTKIVTRVISRLQSMVTNARLSLDTVDMAHQLQQAVTSGTAMKKKVRRILKNTFNQFAKAPSTLVESTTAAMDTPETPIEVTETPMDVSETPMDTIELPMETVEVSQQVEHKEETVAIEEPETVIAKPKISGDSVKTSIKSKKTQKNKTKVKPTPTEEKPRNGVNEERRVTFGKRFTKKFSQSTVTVGVSQGTVKQKVIKSILKRK